MAPTRTHGPGALVTRVTRHLPTGRPLTEDRWRARHRGIVALLLAHVPALFAAALLLGRSPLHAVAEVAPVAALGLLAAYGRGRALRSAAATVGLVASSAMAVHLSGGTIEMHFHFFVVVGVITLYQDWLPFGLAILFVVLHHGVAGALAPEAVYNHPAAREKPWLWAAVHGSFVLAASIAHILAWRLNEDRVLYDELTRLPNRALFTESLAAALVRRRSGRRVSVLVVDLDGFKAVNDAAGHAAGDRVLAEVGARLADVCGPGAIAARLGGDEFAVLLDGCDEAAAVTAAQRIAEALGRPVRLDAHRQSSVGASVGVVAVSAESTVDEVLRNADLALHLAKATGRGIEVFQGAMLDDARQRADLERDLRRAVAAGAVTVHYQPCVKLREGTIAGFEALLRWRDPVRGVVPPGTFVPVAEATGLIVEIGRSTLRTACADIARLRTTTPDLTVAVNVSARQLADETFVQDVAAALADHELPGEALVLEITESMLVDDARASAERLRALRALGVRIALDDFGTGYSSLGYLRHLPVDVLKIDRSFVARLSGEGAALVRSIVRLGHSLGMEVVAEGVEDDEQRVTLTRFGCEFAQGYLFAEAHPSSALEALLERSRASRWWRAELPVPAQRAAQPEPARESRAS